MAELVRHQTLKWEVLDLFTLQYTCIIRQIHNSYTAVLIEAANLLPTTQAKLPQLFIVRTD